MSSESKSAELGVSVVEEREVFNDAADMRRMGKREQFQRNFHFLSIAAFSVIAISGWCWVPSTSVVAIANGQTGGLFIIFTVNWAALTFVVLSLAEMASIAPTAGGQYHWVSEFAPPRIQKVLSYLAGWLSSVAWSAGTTGAMFLCGLTMQGLIVVTNPDYVPKAWQGWMFGVMIATVGLLINTLLARFLPTLENLMFLASATAFIAFLIVLWVVPPTLSAVEVFETIQKGSGWSNQALSLLASQSAIMFLIVGFDSTAHMAEETKNASTVVPKAMIASYAINGAMSFIMTITYCFILVDYESAVESPIGLAGLPFIQVFLNAMGSVRAGVAIVAVLCVLQIFSCATWMASNARQIWGFARDRGFPFSNWISKVDAAGTNPTNAVWCVWGFEVLITLISLGSFVAFEAIVSLQILSLMFTYMVSLSCIIWRRLLGKPLPASPWTLGRLGLPINILGWCYCIYMIIFLPWPVVLPVTAANFNWASVMFVGIMVLSALYYVIWARKVYEGPVVHVRPREE